MNKILKYRLDIADEQAMELPCGSAILSAIEQHGAIVVYALVDDTITETCLRKVRIVGTGHDFADHDKWMYLATVSTCNGMFVWHVFIEVSQ